MKPKTTEAECGRIAYGDGFIPSNDSVRRFARDALELHRVRRELGDLLAGFDSVVGDQHPLGIAWADSVRRILDGEP